MSTKRKLEEVTIESRKTVKTQTTEDKLLELQGFITLLGSNIHTQTAELDALRKVVTTQGNEIKDQTAKLNAQAAELDALLKVVAKLTKIVELEKKTKSTPRDVIIDITDDQAPKILSRRVSDKTDTTITNHNTRGNSAITRKPRKSPRSSSTEYRRTDGVPTKTPQAGASRTQQTPPDRSYRQMIFDSYRR
jgi:hypothetical protein